MVDDNTSNEISLHIIISIVSKRRFVLLQAKC